MFLNEINTNEEGEMMKPHETAIAGKDYFAWQYEEQTQVKHKLLAYYWRIWISKLGKYRDTMFMDCHGGCGAYINPDTQEVEYGSSIIVDKISSEINGKREHKNYICVCENDEGNLKNLRKVWEDQSCSQLCSFKQADFNTVLTDAKVKNFYTTHPSLFFIDPFGYDLIMKNMANLMVCNGSEILINFMFDHMNRFLSLTDLDKQRDAYFGCHDWTSALGLTGIQRENFLVELYKRKLKETTGAKFVFAYRLCYPGKRHTYYYLIHATNDIQGIVHMKNSFAGINNGRMEYLGRYQDELTLFDMDAYKTTDIEVNVLAPYEGKTITFISLLEDIIENVPFIEKDLSETIAMMEKENKLVVHRVSSKRGRYRDQDEITFGDCL